MVWLLRLFGALALAGFAAAVWYAGPLISFNDQRILEPEWIRLAVIAAAILLVGIYYAFRHVQARAAQTRLEQAIAKAEEDETDAPVLRERMTQALDTLRRVTGKRNFLYELPWYVIIGPPGAGKTTALVNSGLNFPLAGADDAQPVTGIGGTRFCDWWFTDEAVLIDTAGRYTTQDSDAKRDSKSWLSFLSVLKRARPTQPLNGILLAFSLQDLMTFDGRELGAHISEIRARLQEIRDTLKIEFPVYVLFTKADLATGFTEFFSSLDETARRQVWGTTFPAGLGAAEQLRQAPALLDDLVRRLSEETTDRLADSDRRLRPAILGFAPQVEALKTQILNFLTGVFDSGRQPAPANLRGFYLSSGTQEGTPIDQFLGAASRAMGRQGKVALSGTGKSFFLHDLLSKVVFGESGLVSFDRAVVRRAAITRYSALGLVGLCVLAALGVIGASFLANRNLVTATGDAIAQYRSDSGPLLEAASVADTDLETVIEALDQVRGLPAGFDNRAPILALESDVGLGQRDRLAVSAEGAYRAALERLFRPRLLLYVERIIEREKATAVALYEPLKVYLTLGGLSPRTDDELILSWFTREWEQTVYPGAQNRAGREQLQKHLQAMLALDDTIDPKHDLNQPLIEGAQRSLGQLELVDRAAAIVEASGHTATPFDFAIAQRAGSEAPVVFTTADGGGLGTLRIPGLYTYEGFNQVFLKELSEVPRKLVDEQWVIGPGGGQVVDEELARVGPTLLERYGKAFLDIWNDRLDKLRLKPIAEDQPEFVVLSAVASPESPIVGLAEAVAVETALTRQPPDDQAESPERQAVADGLRRVGLALPLGKSQNRASGSGGSGMIPGAAVEAQFRPYQEIVAGPAGRRPIDSLSQNFRDIYQTILVAASAPVQSGQAVANLQLQISNLRANASRLPKMLAGMVSAAADDFATTASETSAAQLNLQLVDQLTPACEASVTGTYPFDPAATNEIALQDFGKLFAPGGILDRFFAQNLSALVDTSGATWQWRPDTVGRDFSPQALREFQRAAEIRDAFFPARQQTPSVTLSLTPFSLHSDADTATLIAGDQTIESYQTGNSTTDLVWPGSGNNASARLTLSPEITGRQSAVSFEGIWALKRLLDSASPKGDVDRLELRFLIGGRDVAYTLAGRNPFALPALTEFRCPATL